MTNTMMRLTHFPIYLSLCCGSLLMSTAVAEGAPSPDLLSKRLHNKVAYIPSQCYTKTEDEQGQVHNPCYVCHQRSQAPNYINDVDQQEAYNFPAPALDNHWQNLFEDRTAIVDSISDDAIMRYVRESNYHDADGGIVLANTLANVPAAWDYNHNGQWDGFTPDCYFNFDHEGFDLTPDGNMTGWRAFAYYPLPGTFWPTNGATDDVIIRLAPDFQQTADGVFDREIYKINLAIVEAIIGRHDVAIDPVDEADYGVDLDANGELTTADHIAFRWPPKTAGAMSYVGQAKQVQAEGDVHLAAGLFPEGTEFLHSVRYIDINEQGAIQMAARLKELRYMRKRTWQSYADLEEGAMEEIKEADSFPDRLEQFIGNPEQGMNNGSGWLLQGFIEDSAGALRPQSYEETVFCIGCHGGVGVTTDAVFSYPRKLDDQAFQQGWYHWQQRSMSGLAEPQMQMRDGSVVYEYSEYLRQNRSGNEFRNNDEITAKFYDANGGLKPEMLDALHQDITTLLNPSSARAILLNKGYRALVLDQDFDRGRDANITPVDTVHRRVDQDQPTGIEQPINPERLLHYLSAQQ